jgi:hypothetical protein
MFLKIATLVDFSQHLMIVFFHKKWQFLVEFVWFGLKAFEGRHIRI